jgi:sulfite reductase alpha subunit-like flavoprotein
MDVRLPSISGHLGLCCKTYTERRPCHHRDSIVRRYEGHCPNAPVAQLYSLSGEPADNATKFVDWLRTVEGNTFAGVRYGVFGLGNHDWVNTYQRIPTLCDNLLEQHGGKRLLDRGEGDAGASNFFEVFDEFEAKFWEVLSKVYKALVVIRKHLPLSIISAGIPNFGERVYQYWIHSEDGRSWNRQSCCFTPA